MDLKSKLANCAETMKNTYIKQDVNLRTTLMKSGESEPKSVGADFSIKLNLIEAAAVGAGVLLVISIVSECRDKARERRIMKKLEAQKRENAKPQKA